MDMYTFLVLGQIPGTTVVINFQAWLVIASALLFVMIAGRTYVSIVGIKLKSVHNRTLLHATQLHQRVQ
jgi:hypothetical protein